MNENHKPVFKNPYENVEPFYKLVSKVDEKVAKDLLSIRPIKGTQQIVINLLLQKLHHECIKRGFTNFTRQTDFEQFVAECRLVVPGDFLGLVENRPDDISRSPGVGVMSTPETSNVGGGTPGGSPTHTSPSHVIADLPSSVGKRKPTKGKGRAKG